MACCIKTQDFVDALSASQEVLRLDPNSRLGHYRRAKATFSPINAGVDDFRKALKDLNAILNRKLPGSNPTDAKIKAEIERLNKLVAVNSKRENEVYGKMFNRQGQRGEAGESVTDYVQK